MTAPQASSRLEMLQARFQQRQLLEKEQKLLQLYDQQQLRAQHVAQRGSAGSNGSNSSGNGNSSTMSHQQTVTRTTTSTHSTGNSPAGGKVRQMFDERRQTSVKGIDKSYPLEPLDNRSRKHQSTTTTSNVVVSSTSPSKNGNPMSNRQSLVMRRTVRSEANSNVNGGKPVVSYHEEVSREFCEPTKGDNDHTEFGEVDNRDSRYANGNRHVDQRSDVHIEDVTNENPTQRHRTTAKIHLSSFDVNYDANRGAHDLEYEQFPEDLMIDVPDRLPKRGSKKVSEAEARLERFKNSNTKRPGQTSKQVAGNTTSFTKKRTETTLHSGSTSRASTVERTVEEETATRGRSTTPEIEPTGRPRSLTPEERARKLTRPIVDRNSIVTKASGVSKVSQLTHKNSMDFYPRRKSEFEKSKTFRKLQLELGESSPEPAEPEIEATNPCTKQSRKRSSILVDNIYEPGLRSSSSSPIAEIGKARNRQKSPEPQSRGGSESPIFGRKSSETREETKVSSVHSHTFSSRRRSSTSSVTTDRDTIRGRRSSREMSPEQPASRKGMESPIFEKKSTIKTKETKTSGGEHHSTSVESDFYSSSRRSSSTRPSNDTCSTKGRKVSREKSLESPESRKGSESPVFRRRSSVTVEDIKTSSAGIKISGQESNIHSSRRRSSSASPTPARDPRKERRSSREMSPEQPASRKGSESPIFESKSTIKREETKTSRGGRKSTSVESNFYSSRRRSSSTQPSNDNCPTKGRKVSREKSLERPESRKGSASPTFGRRSTVTKEEIKTSRAGIKNSGQETNIFLTRRRSSSSSPTPTRDSERDRKNSREMSPERPPSRRGSLSPVHRRRSTVTIEEIETIRSQSPVCVRMTVKRFESPRRSSVEQAESKVRKTSGGTLRSFELVKKIATPSNSERKSVTSTLEKKTTLENLENQRPKSRQRSTSPLHRVVKKDKAVMDISKEDQSKINIGRKNSSELREKSSRSRTTSPSPPPSSSMKETASFRAKKAERKNSSETKNVESRHEEKNVRTNLSHEKARNCDLTNVMRSSSPVGDRSRKSSAEITVKRHETFKVSKPSQRIIKIDRESSVDEDDQLPIVPPTKTDLKDKTQLFERIEQIRTTLSKSGRSEQNLSECKDFERTDSVESALRRFDSIGVETEHHVTVGVDEIDRSSASPSPDPAQRSTKEISIDKEKKSVDSRNRTKQNKVTVAVVKAQPRSVDPKARDLSKGKDSRVNLREKISESSRSVRTKKEKSETATTRDTAKPRIGQKITTTLLQKSKLRGEESSGRGEGKISDRSPDCKRRLFEDSESEIETDNSRSTVVLSAITRVTKNPGLVEIETRNNRENLMIGSENMIRSGSTLGESKSDQEQPAKVLRSIEDIRKSIKRESQDFKRELNKFNTAMRKDEKSRLSVSPDSSVTSGVVTCVKITETLRPGDLAPVVKIEKSTVKLPINHRVAKSPSPDIGVKRSNEGRARTPTASARRTVPSSPAKSPDSTSRYGSADSKNFGQKPLARTSPSPSAAKEDQIRSEISRSAEYSDCTDGPVSNSELIVTESVYSTTTKRNDAFVIELDDDEVPRKKEISLSSQKKPTLRKQTTEKSLVSQKQQRSPTVTPLSRPASALSTSSTGSARGQTSQLNSKSRMSTKTKPTTTTGPKGPPANVRGSNAAAPVNDGLAACNTCGRRFNSDRITLHEQICSKTATKKRKQFDATVHRVRGTELESFVVKKGGAKKGQSDRKTSKPEVKSNWRKKHEDFINAIRSAKQVQAHLAAGGKLSDLPPPPPSDNSDYIQCPHCGRKFNQGAADRHIPKCQNMMHNKPNPRAPPKPKR